LVSLVRYVRLSVKNEDMDDIVEALLKVRENINELESLS